MDRDLEKRKKVLMDLFHDPLYIPMKQKEIAILLNLPSERRPELAEALESLVLERKIEISKRGKYSIMREKHLLGTYCGHQSGFGFVTLEEGDSEDIFIPSGNTMGAMHGDLVEIILTAAPKGKRQEGKVISIKEHNTREIVGFFESSKNFGFVRPDNQKLNEDIYIPKNACNGAKRGDKVIVSLTSYGTDTKKPEGKIVEIIGNVDDPGVDVMSIARAYGLTPEFPEEVENELASVPDEVLDSDKVGRRNLKDVMMVTIDGEDAKDLDDAVSLTIDEDGLYHLGVHIADVSHYVKEKTALNKEGYNRGTSVYLADRVIPMLPKKLSNGLCSLNEGKDRLALSCLMVIDEKGTVVEHEICESLINVDRRMSYTAVNGILTNKDEALCKQYEEFVPMFENMAKLSEILIAKRKKRGAIDFDVPETKVILDENGHCIDLKPYERNVATMLIESFMLAANETVAEEYFWKEIPFLYRVHEKPDPEKIAKLANIIGGLGLSIKGSKGDVHPKELQKLLGSMEGRPEENLVIRMALRSMQQAKYTPENLGHFGLAAKYYCHFTSPIRRYPDLQIHRIIKEDLQGKLNDKRISHYEEMLDEVGMHTSSRERRAEEVERETVKLKKIDYMMDKFDMEFKGVISGVTNWGIYVELPNTVEGLVHMNHLTDDYYEYDEVHMELVGKANNKHYRLGQEVTVRLDKVDKMVRTIDFVLVEG